MIGRNMIKMDALKQMYQDLGYKNIQTYIQSGNVIFQSRSNNAGNIEKKISRKILESCKFHVTVIVMETSEMKEIFRNNPYVNRKSDDMAKRFITFLSEKPLKENLEKINGGDYKPDEFTIINRAVYVFCPDGYARTKLYTNFFEKRLKVKATSRNLNTINNLVLMADEIKSKK